MFDRIAEVAMHPFSLAVVAVASTANMIAGTLAAEVNDGVLVGLGLFVLGTGTGIIGWALVLVVKLSNIVNRLEVTAEDHERRIARVEDNAR